MRCSIHSTINKQACAASLAVPGVLLVLVVAWRACHKLGKRWQEAFCQLSVPVGQLSCVAMCYYAIKERRPFLV